MWCTTRKPKGSLYTRSLTKLFEHSYRSINNILLTIKKVYTKAQNTDKILRKNISAYYIISLKKL